MGYHPGEQGFVHQPALSCVEIHGRTYHHVLPAEMQGHVCWCVHDPQLRREEAISLRLDQQLMDAIQQTLAEINPQEPAEEIFLRVESKEEQREIAIIIHRVDSEVTGSPCTVVFWRRTELEPTFISSLHPLYEQQQCPLTGFPGMMPWLRLVLSCVHVHIPL